VVGGEVAVGDAEIPLQLDGVAGRQRHQRLQRERRCERDVGRRDLTLAALDLGPFGGCRGG
jgi:hypothetical protein